MVKKISLLAPDLSGGGGTRVYLLAQVLQKLNYDVTVFGFLFGENLYPLPPANLTVKWVKGCNYPQVINFVRQLLGEIDGDILYAVKPRPTSLGIALLKRLTGGGRILLDLDDWELSWFGGDDWHYRPTIKQLAKDLFQENGALRDPEHPLYLQWMEKLIDRVDGVTVNNRFLEYRYGGTYLPNGRDIDLFDCQKFDPDFCREKLGLGPYRVLMFPGTARPHKGLEDVFAALDNLNREDLRLVLVGGREIGDGYVEKLIAQWPQWAVKWPPLPPEQMPEIVAAAHIIVVPQRKNLTALAQFPMKLTDGMAMAKPIITTKVGDIPEILGDCGYLVDPGSPEQIAATIESIFADFPAALELGQKARARCVSYYSLEPMADILSKALKLLN